MLPDTKMAYLTPKWQTVYSAWAEHLPAAFWLVEQLRPKSFVELGSHAGDSYCTFCQAFVQAGLDQEGATAMAVDTWEGDEHSHAYGEHIYEALAAHHNPQYAHFSQLNRTLFDEARKQVEDGTLDLLHIDGLHTYEAVKHDFETWIGAMREGGVILFHDVTERAEGFGVWKFWEEITPLYPHLLIPHGHGLGIIAVGEAPAALAPFLSAAGVPEGTPAQKQLIDWLYALGRGCEAKRLQLVAEARTQHVQGDHDHLAKLHRQLESHCHALEEALEEAREEHRKTEAHLQALQDSTSWKLTAPIRKLKGN